MKILLMIALLLIIHHVYARDCSWIYIDGKGDIYICSDEAIPDPAPKVKILGYPKCIKEKIHDGTSYRYVERCYE